MHLLGQNLRKLLSIFALSENELARRTGVPQQVINRILSGENQNPKVSTLMPLARYFKITISQLLGEDDLPIDPRIEIKEALHQKIPLLNWNDITKAAQGLKGINRFVLTDALISDRSFAIRNHDDSMEPKFSQDCTLIFDSNVIPKSMDYILLELEDNTVRFRQLWIKDEKLFIKCLNPKHECFKLKEIENKVKIIATLVQSKSNFSS